MSGLKKILSLMERMGEIVTPFHPFDIMIDNEPLLIKEGLIMSYPTDRVVDAISSLYHLTISGSKNNPNYDKLRGNEEEAGDISIKRPNGKDEVIVVSLPSKDDVFDGINAHLLKYGWVNYRTDETSGGYEFYFEKRFGDRFSVKQLLKVTDKIYHATSSRLVKKITSQGLTPKESKTPGFDNEPRIYFRVDMPSKDMAEDLARMKGDNSPAVVLEIDLAALKPSQSFFFDPRWPNSIFTFEPIPPTAIRVMDDGELPKIKLNY